ncbi:hypothetical protein [Nonomuraea jiangxiensis]|uniref:Uncharacterized protein n=1 Tax=Nonomuraea jiangxiensis TaxID=633440 RepID=A0A1G9I4T1_9ACTN|nr:hypothetical protein [Nonomuraea jiangxiensis]SDL19874.1 hypothetical protein SAMN05421869_12373 [Nonomuraea jiangxiensis]
MNVVHLRPTLFLEWLQYFWILPKLREGVLSMPVGKGTSSPVAAGDNIEKLTGRRSMTVGEYARAHAGLLTGVNV